MNPNELLRSDVQKPAGRLFFGQSGSGKSFLLHSLIDRGMRDPSYGADHRFVVIDIKHEYTFPKTYQKKQYQHISDLRKAIESISQNRVTLVYPPLEDADIFLNVIIEYLFEAADELDTFSASLVVEESSMYVSPQTIDPSLQRVLTQGRSKRIVVALANQRFLTNRWIDNLAASMVAFPLAIPDRDILKRRWGLDGEGLNERLLQVRHSFAVFDLETQGLSYYHPIGSKGGPEL